MTQVDYKTEWRDTPHLVQFAQEVQEAAQFNATLDQKVAEMRVEIGKLMYNAEGRLDVSKMKSEEFRQQAAQHGLQYLIKEVKTLAKSESDDPFLLEQLVLGLFGISASTIQTTLDKMKDKYSGLALEDQLTNQNNVAQYLKGQRLEEKPKTVLSEDDGKDVVAKTETVGKVDPAKLTINDMAGLLQQYLAQGSIGSEFLADKRYAIKESRLKLVG